MNDLTICKRNRNRYIREARADACDPGGTDSSPSPGYWELFFDDDADLRKRKLKRFKGYIEPNAYFTDMEARLALCLYADMLEGYGWP